MHIGILGAGKLGTVLGRHAVAAGHETTLAGSGTSDTLGLIVGALVPGARTSSARELSLIHI